MQRVILFASLLLLAGCNCTPDGLVAPTPTGEPWDTTYLIAADPSTVTNADLATHTAKLTEHYWKYNQVEGVIWPGWRSDGSLEFPDNYGTGGDGGIFTGIALATYALEYGTMGTIEAFDRAMKTLKGVYWLTHAAGRGVIARCVFPIADGIKWGYPGPRWQKYPEFMRPSPAITAPWGETFPAGFYYTRGTKDQLTGILTGLSVAWMELKDSAEARTIIAIIVEDLRQHLVKHNWKIRNENGKNDTNADTVSRLLRAQFDALYRHTVMISNPAGEQDAITAYRKSIKVLNIREIEAVPNITNNYSQYYAHSLRLCRAFSIWLLENDLARKQTLVDLIKNDVWRYTKHHQNAWFAAFVAAVDPSDQHAKQVLNQSLRSLYFKPLRMWGSPYGGQKHEPGLDAVLSGCDRNWVVAPHLRKPINYMTWQKRPWDVGSGQDKEGLGEETGLDYLVVYWMGKAYGGL